MRDIRGQRLLATERRIIHAFGSPAVLRQNPSNEAYNVTTGTRSSASAPTDYSCYARQAEGIDITDPPREGVLLTDVIFKVIDLPDGVVPTTGDVLFDGPDVTTARSYKVLDVTQRRTQNTQLSWFLHARL